MEDCLKQCRPLEALQTCLAGLQSPDASTPDIQLHREDSDLIIAQARSTAIKLHGAEEVIAACVALTALCDAPVLPLCIDVAALTALDAGANVSKETVAKLAEDLAACKHQSVGPTVVQDGEPSETRACPSDQEARCKDGCLAGEAVAQALAETILTAEQEKSGGPEETQAVLSAARHWALLQAFCAQHRLPCDSSHLRCLAARNDWIFFLAEASTHTVPLEQVAALAAAHFTDGSLRHHVLHVLMGQLDPGRKHISTNETGRTGDKSEELFEILHAALQTESPEAELLRQSVQLQWPILAILAACQPEASAPRCMAAWLQATMHSEGVCSAKQGADASGRQQARTVLREACRKGAYDAAADAVQIFMPACPLLKCLRMLQAASQQRYADMLRHREELTSAMTPPPARRPGSSGEGETEAEWVMRVTWAAADDLLAGVPSWTERVPVLEHLGAIDLPVPGGSGAEQYQHLVLLYELMEGRADGFIAWPGSRENQPAHERVDAQAALQALLDGQEWAKASRWAAATGQQQHGLTLARAHAVLADWQRLMWLPGQRQHAWEHIQQLFTEHQLPALNAAHFLVTATERLASKGLLNLQEQTFLIQDTISWLRKARLPEQAAGMHSDLLRRMTRALQLLSARLALSDAPVSLPRSQKVPLLAPWAIREEEGEGSKYTRFAADSATSDAREPGTDAVAVASDSDEAAQQCEAMRISIDALTGEPSKAEITAALRSVLEHGDVARARSLARELASPPIDLVLAEAAAGVMQHCHPAVSQEAGKSVRQAVPAAVLSYLSKRGHEKTDTPLDVLDALEACAAKGAARALCALAASSFRAATLLGMTCKEAASLGPRQSLQVLLMKGPQAAPLAIQYAAAYHLSMEQTAEVLADSLLKGLLAAHHDSGGAIRDAWTAAGFREACEDLGAPDALGSALMQALLERHGALPAEVEGGLLAAAHACYEAGACADALEVLVQLAARAMQQWAQSRQWRPLAQLMAGMGHYRALRWGLDILVANDQLELLLSRRSANHSNTGARVWRAAVMAAIQRQRPNDGEAWDLARHHFGCARETAASLQSKAQERAEGDIQVRKAGLQESMAHLNAMSAAIAAARAYAEADCCRAAVSAAQTAIELGQQVQGPCR